MDHEALSALESEVQALRILAAEKSVHARSMDGVTPPSEHATFATLILAVLVLVAFVAGRYAGITHAHALGPSEPTINGVASIVLERGTHVTMLDTRGNVNKDGHHSHVAATDVETLALDMLRSCWGRGSFSRTPNGPVSIISLRVNGRYFAVSHSSLHPDPIERRIDRIASAGE